MNTYKGPIPRSIYLHVFWPILLFHFWAILINILIVQLIIKKFKIKFSQLKLPWQYATKLNGDPWTWFNKRENCRRWVVQFLTDLLDQEDNIIWGVVFICILFRTNNYFWYSIIKIIFINRFQYFFVKTMGGLWWFKYKGVYTGS